MARVLGEKRYLGKDLNAVLMDAHRDAKRLSPSRPGKVWTRIEEMGSGEDETSVPHVWARVSMHEDD